MDYNHAQQEAVLHKDGPMMVLAGPGSGKTMVITGRTRTLIEQYGILPEQILVITFTKAAATEMKERFFKLTGISFGVRFSTFHSLFFFILRSSYGYTPEQIVQEDQQRVFLREEIIRLSLDVGDEKDFIRDVLAEISQVKSAQIDPSHYESNSCSKDTFRQLYNAYHTWLRDRRLLDFDDMMLLVKELFLARPDILSIWRSRWHYILIDEFQDIDQLQYTLIRMLAAPKNNLFIVGDDDQSIYRFRGARPEIMLHFQDDYPDSKKVLLDQNYRSTDQIVSAAGRLISVNQKRFPKTIQAANKTPAASPHYLIYPERKTENTFIARELLRLRDQGIPFSQTAILYRTNREIRSIAETLMTYHIPFLSKESIPNLYEHWISRNVLAYLQLARMLQQTERGKKEAEPLSRIRNLLLQVMNRPNRYLSRESLPDTTRLLDRPTIGQEKQVDMLYLLRYLALWKNNLREKGWMVERLEKLQYDLTSLSHMDPYTGIHYIRHVIGYEQYLTSYAQFRHISLEELTEQLEELHTNARCFPTLGAWETHIQNYTKELIKQRQEKLLSASDMNAVTLSTMHASKGLEYPVVFLPDVVEGITPHKKALKEDEIEEERRLFYVAVTRAKQHLYVLTSQMLFGKPQMPSRFLAEMNPELPLCFHHPPEDKPH